MITKLNVAPVMVLDQEEALLGIRDPFGNAIRILQRAKVARR